MADRASEQVVERFLISRGFKPLTFDKETRRRQKTPDFYVQVGSECTFYCEVKTNSEDQVAAPSFWGLAGIRLADPLSKLSNDIHTAAQQFDSVNPLRERPNVLAFVNHQSTAGSSDLYELLTGNILAGDQVLLSSNQHFAGRVQGDRLKIDMYLWFHGQSDEPAIMIVADVNRDHHDLLCRLFGSDPRRVPRLPL